jgi:hypothetical protein
MGQNPDHDNAPHRLVVMPVLTGAGAFGLFYGAARLARHIPVLNQAITTVLRYAENGSAPLVLLTAAANAVAEELFFRGALWSLTEQAHPIATTTLAYTATTAVTRNPALTIAGAATSVLFGLQRRASGGVLAPALTHLTWSLLMLNFLPPLFETPQPRPHASTLSSEREACMTAQAAPAGAAGSAPRRRGWELFFIAPGAARSSRTRRSLTWHRGRSPMTAATRRATRLADNLRLLGGRPGHQHPAQRFRRHRPVLLVPESKDACRRRGK